MATGKKDEEGKAGGKIDQDKAKFTVVANKLPSKLDSNVQDLIEFIFDEKMMAASVVAVGYDVNKMPLGELSRETVLKGYAILR